MVDTSIPNALVNHAHYPWAGSCWDLCPSGNALVTPAYPPIPTLTTYRRVQIPAQPWIDACPTGPGACKPWWVVQAFGWDKFQAPNLLPPDENAFDASQPLSMIKVLFEWHLARSRVVRIIADLGEGISTIVGPTHKVRVDFMLPELRGNEVIPPQFQNLDLVGYTLGVGACVVADGGDIQERLTFTQSLYLDVATQPTQVINIPPFAREMQFYQTGEPVTPPNPSWIFDPLVPVSLGEVVRGANTEGSHLVPQNAKQLSFSITGEDPSRIVTVIFKLGF